jgi:cobalt-zinc-cadmium resistance protein CzcA
VLKAGGGGRSPWLVRKLHAVYDPFLAWAMVNPLKVGAAAVAGLVPGGRALHPDRLHLHAGDGRGHAGGDAPQAPRRQRRAGGRTDMVIQRQILEQVPEVRGIMGRAGADELGIDPSAERQRPVPHHRAARGVADKRDPDFVINEVRKVLDGIPGISYAVNQPIDMRCRR